MLDRSKVKSSLGRNILNLAFSEFSQTQDRLTTKKFQSIQKTCYPEQYRRNSRRQNWIPQRVQIFVLSDSKCKTNALNMFRAITEEVENKNEEQETLQKEQVNWKDNQVRLPEMKNIIIGT